MKGFYKIVFVLFLLSGCSGEEPAQQGNNEHVWKAQTDSLDKARAVEDLLQQDAADKSRMIDEPGQ